MPKRQPQPKSVQPEAVLNQLGKALQKLDFVDAIYGYRDSQELQAVVIGDRLSSDQRNAVWNVYWDFVRQYPDLDIDVLILQRDGRSLAETWQSSDTPTFSFQRNPVIEHAD